MLTSLISLLLALPAALPPGARPTPDSTGTPVPNSLKLGVTTAANGQLSTLALERQLRPRLTLQARLGYGARTFSESYSLPGPGPNTVPYTRRVRQAEATAHLRYYIGRHPKPLSGWYAGLGLGLARLREEGTRPQSAAETRTRLLLCPQVQVGGQYVFGRHFLLDVFLGLGAAQQRSFSFAPTPRRFWDFYAANGLQVGYAF
ncbi:DUF3575 domain-containing protein [Hymenobacter persicinus]|uniref:DUF3575 domain-containing protein n=1 Tax=Hymenobacter persicinus TaxID=2025506 RepID=A0A4Q5LH55_9BACT|nr:DUF3575 domain-containing protein [Hymenobacter persicinus]RYU83340.1 DUF3575 domain-containing protein [Hymenobacter persicinus]